MRLPPLSRATRAQRDWCAALGPGSIGKQSGQAPATDSKARPWLVQERAFPTLVKRPVSEQLRQYGRLLEAYGVQCLGVETEGADDGRRNLLGAYLCGYHARFERRVRDQ